MSLLDQLGNPACWETFYQYKLSLACPGDSAKELRRFIDAKGYEETISLIREGATFPLPRKSIISKQSSQKKRTVYTYPPGANMVLKLLTHLLLRRYDGLFCDTLFSFRPGKSARDAIRRLKKIPRLTSLYSYKVDISNYFNSIPVGRLLPILKEVTAEDPALYAFLSALLLEEQVIDRGKIITEQKGIMAGTPLSSFYANLYLMDLDRSFTERGIPYARYSDDIILFGKTPEEVQGYAAQIRDYLASKELSVNPAKETFSSPEEGFVFLGFFLKGEQIDIAPASVDKLKAKMRRKTRALQRWRSRNELEGEKAAKAFIRIFNRKLLESSADNDLSWRYWFFSVITTAESLQVIDHYAQDCIRFLLTGRRTKARFNARYEDLKELGYQSLVHAYYDFTP